jgi:hypothetical protein
MSPQIPMVVEQTVHGGCVAKRQPTPRLHANARQSQSVYPRCTREAPVRVKADNNTSLLQGFSRKALFRTRTGGSLLTMEAAASGYVMWETRLIERFTCKSDGFSACSPCP